MSTRLTHDKIGPTLWAHTERPRDVDAPGAVTHGGMNSMSAAHATAPKRKPVKGVKNLFVYDHDDGSKSFYLLASINGKQHYEKLAATNKTDAEQERNVRVGELRSDGRIELRVGEDLTFAELATRFIEHERGPSAKLTKRTADLREQLLTKHVVPALGDMKGRSITTPHVQALSDRLTSRVCRVAPFAASLRRCPASWAMALGTVTSRRTRAGKCRCRQRVARASHATSTTRTCCASWTLSRRRSSRWLPARTTQRSGLPRCSRCAGLTCR